jgi:uncharacterized membrane protein
MYKIIGADKKEYGPVSDTQMREWIQQGRVGPNTLAQADGQGDWRPVIAFPEFAEALAAKSAPAPPPAASAVGGLSPEILERDYQLDIGGCISRGWDLMQKNMGLLIGATLIYFGIEFAISLLGAIPLIGPLFSIANIFISAPLLGGLYFVILQAIRRRPATAGDVFEGFRRRFGQLILGQLVTSILAGLCLIPAGIAAAVVLFPAMAKHQEPTPAMFIIIGLVALICVIPMVFMQVNWMFSLPLIVDRGMDFWPAMQASWKKVRTHWWQVFGLILLCGLINVVGLLACCVGLIFSIPLGFAAMMYAYETIFGESPAPTT